MRPCSRRWGWNLCNCGRDIHAPMNPRIDSARVVTDRIEAELADLESRAQLRRLEAPAGIDLSSNDYLGLATDPRMKQAILQALDSAPRIASTGSRLLSGHDEAWTALEMEFAKWVGAETALYFTSGYAANVGLLSAILRPEDVVFSDSANHASLIDGMRLAKCKRVVFPHLDLNFLENELRRNSSAAGARVIVVESIFSMEGDRAPLADLADLAERHGAELIFDEAHAIGVRGPGGSGCVAAAGTFRARAGHGLHLRQGARRRGRVRVRLGKIARVSYQSRPHVYFQYGAAALFCRASLRRNAPGRRGRCRARAPGRNFRDPEK